MRVADKVAVVVGAGQTEGQTVGNGRAVALLFAREGAKILVADRDLASAEETVRQIETDGGTAFAVRVDVTKEEDISTMISGCLEQFGRVDILHNNVGVSLVGGDAAVTDIEADAFARIMSINLQGMVLACKHAIPVMRRQGNGVITNISSNAVTIDYPYVAYKTSKAGVVALTEHLAIRNAPFGIRANTILPGLMATPMAIEHRLGEDSSREQIMQKRQERIPLRDRMGTALDVANAALFLSSDEASFITGASLVVDGGQSLVVG